MSLGVNYKVKGEGIPFVFQHGLAANLNQSLFLLEGVENIKLISMDCPGHGSSSLEIGNPPSFSNYADQVLRLIEKLNVDKAIFGGISMGAGIAMNIALRFPEKVRALVLVRPAWIDKQNPENLAILSDAAKAIGLKNGQAQFIKNKEFIGIEKRLPKAADSVIGVFSEEQQSVLPMVLKEMVSDKPFDNLSELNNINTPCLIITNDDDPLHPLEMANSIHKHIRGSELKRVISRYVDDAKHQTSVRHLISNFIATHEKLLERS